MKIDGRYLVGLGIRNNLYKSDQTFLFYGIGSFFEYQKFLDTNGYKRNIRINNYISYNFKSNNIEFSNIFYFQPLITDDKYYRIFNEIVISNYINKSFSFDNNFYIIYDNLHVIGIPEVIYKYETKLVYKF